MPNVKVKLSRSYMDFHANTQFDTIELREPTYKDVYLSGLGNPQEFQPNGHGGAVLITHVDVIAQYINKLMVNPDDPGVLSQIAAIDGMKLEKAVLDFFTEPAMLTEPPISSSSDLASPSTPSST